MVHASSTPRLRVLVALCVALLLACAGSQRGAARYEFFGTPRSDDPWSPKIAGWQSRERASTDPALGTAPASVSGPGAGLEANGRSSEFSLRSKYALFRARQKRAQARELAEWIQAEARHHYLPDGPIDHWATLGETLERDGDDCDGLELLVYRFLRDLGFGDDEVYRAIVYRPSDGQHHMVTLWFEHRDDPWVIDPTGAMTTGMPRLSAVPEWIPLKIFSETREFTARRRLDPKPGALASLP